jgi:hypothetical protein
VCQRQVMMAFGPTLACEKWSFPCQRQFR